MTATETRRFHEQHQAEHTVSYSQIAVWLMCRQKWQYQYAEQLRPVEQMRPPTLGSLVHELIAGHLLGGDVETLCADWVERQRDAYPRIVFQVSSDDDINTAYWDQIEANYMEQIYDVAHDGLIIARRTVAYLREQGWSTVLLDGKPAAEIEILRPLGIKQWRGFASHIDWIAKDQDGRLWLVDFKVRRQLVPVEAEETNIQHAIYQRMVREEYGIQLSGTVTMQVLAKIPAWPKQNKDGSMSRARVATDWETYERALLDAGLDPVDYEEEMRPKLDAEFFRPSVAYRSNREIDTIWHDVVDPVAREIVNTNRRRIYRNLNHMTCGRCEYRELCLAEVRGHDAEFIRQARFYVRQPGLDEPVLEGEEESA